MIPALVGGAATLLGGAAKNSAAKSQAKTQYANDIKAARLQRQWQLVDQKDERRYNRAELNESRRYNEKQMQRALMYNARQLKESREYNRRELAESRAYSRGELGRLVQDAQKAGFNPLTVLRNGGGAGYSAGAGFSPLSSGAMTSSSLTSGALSATPLSRQAPVEQAVGGSPVGDAISQFGRDFMSSFDPFADDKREQEYRLVESQIASYNAGALSMSAPPAVQSYPSSDYDQRPTRKAAVLSSNKVGEGTIVGGDDPTVSSMGWNDGKTGWFHAPWMPDASVWENIYGENEIGSSFYGLSKVVSDGVYSGYRYLKDGWDKAKNTKFDPKYREEYYRNIRETVPSLIPR